MARRRYKARTQKETQSREEKEANSLARKIETAHQICWAVFCNFDTETRDILVILTGTPHRSRTCNLWYRKPMLYPVELTGHSRNGKANSFSINGTPSWVRTSDLRLRSPLLYPAELSGRTIVLYQNILESVWYNTMYHGYVLWNCTRRYHS